MTIEALVKPGSKNPGITEEAGTLVVRVRARAVEGAANAECIRALADYFRVAATRVELVRGTHSRRKLFSIPD